MVLNQSTSTLLLIGLSLHSLFSSSLHAEEAIPKMLQNLSNGRLTYEMAEILSEKISHAATFKTAYDKANSYSEEICGVKGDKRHSRDEVDAVRHFIGAAILSSQLGKEYVKRLLTAHEKRSSTFNDENYMDLNNNQLGLDFGPTIPYIFKEKKIKKASGKGWRKITVEKRDHSLSFFQNEISQRIANGKLFVLQTGSSLCANPKVFPNMKR